MIYLYIYFLKNLKKNFMQRKENEKKKKEEKIRYIKFFFFELQTSKKKV